MDAKERTAKAISITRVLLSQALDDPRTMIALTDSAVLPELIMDEVYNILKYLEKTAPDKTKDSVSRAQKVLEDALDDAEKHAKETEE